MYLVYESLPYLVVKSYPPNYDHAAAAVKLHSWLRRAFPCGVMMELEKLLLAEHDRRSVFVEEYRQAVEGGRAAKWLKEHDVEVF